MKSGSETRQRVRRLPPVRCTAEEQAGIVSRAAAAGVTVSQFVREAALAKPAPGYKPRRRQPQADVAELARISGLLGKFGSNVNQLAHIANSDGELPTEAELKEIAGHVRELQMEVRKALGGGH